MPASSVHVGDGAAARREHAAVRLDPDQPADASRKPASPPYQPEIPAEAIHTSAHHRRKSIKVGWPTLEAIWGDRLASPLLDRYLARDRRSRASRPTSRSRPTGRTISMRRCRAITARTAGSTPPRARRSSAAVADDAPRAGWRSARRGARRRAARPGSASRRARMSRKADRRLRADRRRRDRRAGRSRRARSTGCACPGSIREACFAALARRRRERLLAHAPRTPR